jgi:hypothetical protein
VTPLIKSPGGSQDLDLPAAITRSLIELRVARSHCLGPTGDLSTIAAVRYQLELRDTLLFNLAETRSNLARQMVGAALRGRPSLASPKAKMPNTRYKYYRYCRYPAKPVSHS